MKEKKHYLSQQLQKNFSKIKPKDVHKYLTSIDYDHRNYHELADGFFFIIVQFKGSSTYLKNYFWNSNLMQVEDPFNSGESFYQQKNVSTSFYDFIMILDKDKIKLAEMDAVKADEAIKLSLKNK